MDNKNYFTKQIDDDVVDSYIIQTYDSGITCLCINTKERWVDFHRSTNDRYELSNNVSWDGDKSIDNTYTLNIDGEGGDYLNSIYKHIVT